MTQFSFYAAGGGGDMTASVEPASHSANTRTARDTALVSLALQILALLCYCMAPIGRWGQFEYKFMQADTSMACQRVQLDLGSFYVSTVPAPAGNISSSCPGYGDVTVFTDAEFSDKFLAGDPAYSASKAVWTTMLASKKAGAGCYIFLIVMNFILLGNGIASTAIIIRQLHKGLIQKTDIVYQVGCCGCGERGGGLSDPCTNVGMMAGSFGLTVSIALIAWPATMGIVMAAYISGVSALETTEAVFYPSGYVLLPGYSVTGFALFFTAIALILGVLSRDAYRRHAYASVVRMRGGESNPTVVVMPPGGTAVLAAEEGSSFVSSSYGGAPAFNSLGYGVPKKQSAEGYQ
jgi:hypothetical protein